jgi:hypothetical protein
LSEQTSTVPPPIQTMSPNKVIFWRDVFVLVDNGKARVNDYAHFGRLILEQKAKYKAGIGSLVIIPEGATPPPDEVRKAINRALNNLDDGLRCFCWIVEGSGFQAAVARGVLTGIRLFGRHRYPTQIETNLEEALAWILPHLDGGKKRLADVPAAAAFIRHERGALLQ